MKFKGHIFSRQIDWITQAMSQLSHTRKKGREISPANRQNEKYEGKWFHNTICSTKETHPQHSAQFLPEENIHGEDGAHTL